MNNSVPPWEKVKDVIIFITAIGVLFLVAWIAQR